jgi:hypothetical protein
MEPGLRAQKNPAWRRDFGSWAEGWRGRDRATLFSVLAGRLLIGRLVTLLARLALLALLRLLARFLAAALLLTRLLVRVLGLLVVLVLVGHCQDLLCATRTNRPGRFRFGSNTR